MTKSAYNHELECLNDQLKDMEQLKDEKSRNLGVRWIKTDIDRLKERFKKEKVMVDEIMRALDADNCIFIGTIKLSKKAVVSDPCYDLGTWCAAILDNVVPGTYYCYVKYYSDDELWGRRVSSLIVKHESCKDIPIESIDKEEDYNIGVDSGMCGIYDYEYFKQEHTDENSALFLDKAYDATFDTACHLFKGGILDNGKGVVSSAGFGDGSYILYTKRDEAGDIVAMKIVYIFEEDEIDEKADEKIRELTEEK